MQSGHPPKLSMAARPPLSPVTAPGKGFFAVFSYSRRALELVWTTSRGLSVALAALTLVAGALPAGIAFVGARIVDAVGHEIQAVPHTNMSKPIDRAVV